MLLSLNPKNCSVVDTILARTQAHTPYAQKNKMDHVENVFENQVQTMSVAEPSAKRQKHANPPQTKTPGANEGPVRPWVTAMLTDLYHMTMAYAYWSSGRHNDQVGFVFAAASRLASSI